MSPQVNRWLKGVIADKSYEENKQGNRIRPIGATGGYSGLSDQGVDKWVDIYSLPGNLPNPGIEPRSPALQVDSLPAEQQGKPKDTGVGSLSLLQWLFLTQESNWGLLHCRWILYQLSYQKSSMNLLENIRNTNILLKPEKHFHSKQKQN